jgi:hypothetical protein
VPSLLLTLLAGAGLGAAGGLATGCGGGGSGGDVADAAPVLPDAARPPDAGPPDAPPDITAPWPTDQPLVWGAPAPPLIGRDT